MKFGAQELSCVAKASHKSRITDCVLVTLALLLAAGLPAQAQTYTELHVFAGYSSSDGANPSAGLSIDSNGYLYGTTVYGGANGFGSVFKIQPSGSNSPTTILHSFSGQTDGAAPVSRVVFAPDGVLYGTTAAGQSDNCNGVGGCGTIFTLSPSLGGYSWSFNTLYTFDGAPGDGSDPYGDLTFQNNNVYGTTRYGGSGGGQAICGDNSALTGAERYGCGTVFEMHYIPPPGQSDDPTILWNFDATSGDGIEPYGGVVVDCSTNLFGTTLIGGQHSYGTTFQLIPGSPWTETILKAYDDGTTNGGYPFGGLILDSSNNLYGSNADAGASGAGEIFKITNGANCTLGYSTLTSLSGTQYDLQGNRANLVMDSQGNLWGTQTIGGANNYGDIFELTAGTWAYHDVHDFDGTHGAYPAGSLVVDNSGNLYGVTYSGGQGNCVFDSSQKENILGCGIVFEYTP